MSNKINYFIEIILVQTNEKPIFANVHQNSISNL